MLHYRGVARTRFWKYSDALLCVFGLVAMAYATSLTIVSWATEEPKRPGYCERRGMDL